MKTLFLILSFIISTNSITQSLLNSNDIVIGSNLSEEDKVKYSGMELQLHTKEFYKGVKMIGVGQALVWSGVQVMMNSSVQIPIQSPPHPEGCINCVQEPTQYVTGVNYSKKTLGGVLTVAGGILSIIGTYHILAAPIHIKNAGLILSGNGVGIVIKM